MLTSSTRRPASASWIAVAQAIEVLPTPPLPVKKRKRGALSRNFMAFPQQQRTCRRSIRFVRFGGFLDARPARQLCAVRVASGERDIAINEDQRQRLLTRTLQKAFHRGVLGESHRLLGEIEALDLRAVLLGPVDIRREGDKRLIGIDAADARAATKRGIENLDGRHFSPFRFGVERPCR